MQLAFDTKPLRLLCESEAQAKRDLGGKVAETLKHRLADLRAAASVKDLMVGEPRKLSGPDSGRMAITLPDGHTLVFGANHPNNPKTGAGELDWGKVSRIKILSIGRDL